MVQVGFTFNFSAEKLVFIEIGLFILEEIWFFFNFPKLN